MKKLLLFLLSLILSFHSYGEWTELPASNPEEQGFIDFDNLQERSDEYVYWWMMTSYSNRSEKFYIQSDCQAGRIKPLQEDYHNEPMGGGDLTSSTESDIGWYYPAPDTGIYRFVEVACEMARETPEEREKSVANLLMELEYKNKINKLSEEAEVKLIAEEAKANEIIADAETKTKIEEAKAKKAEVKRMAEEAKAKEAEILASKANEIIADAETKRKQEEVKTKLAEIKRKAEEAKAQEAEILAKEATALVKEAEEIRINEEAKAKNAEKEFRESEAKRIAEELKLKLAEAKRVALEIKIKAAEVKQSTIEAETKDAELLVKEASKQLEEDQQNKDLLELEIAALKEAEAEIQYRQLLAKEVQDEQDTARSIIIEDQLNTLQNAYINNIAARVKTFWRYQAAEDDWTAEVLVVQDSEGNVKAVNVKNANVGNSSLGKSFKDSIERAIYMASPLPSAPDEAVFDKELYFLFSIN